MKILGIDPSVKSTGFAVLNDGQVEAQYKSSYSGGITDHVQRLYQLKVLTIEICKNHNVDYVAIEKPMGRFFNGLRGTYHAECACLLGAWEAKVTAISYRPTEWKKIVLGKGNANKQEGVDYALELAGEVETEDCADAICIAMSLHKELQNENEEI